jgi:ABC-2 type transport system ATP-binding protein
VNIAEVNNLRKEYPSFQLKDISFSIQKGKITGFIGRNGAGKTTTIKSILNLVHPDRGEVSFFGFPLAGHESDIKKRIGYSTGTVSWYPRKKIRDIVRIVREFYETWDDEAYRKYLALFNLDENKTPRELSEGMKVKFNLLIALSHGAEILILDEPTSGLDPFSRDELLGAFSELKEHGVAIFFSTHIISDLEKCADDIVYISNGEIAAALPKKDFTKEYSQEGESLEDTILRMERMKQNEKTERGVKNA